MIEFILIIVLALMLLLVLAVAAFFVLTFVNSFTTKVPFVPIPKIVLSKVVKALAVREGSLLYDLGCGDGRVLAACYNVEPNAKYIGFDKDLIPICFAKSRLWQAGKLNKITVQKKDFFKEDLSGATHVFTYLFPTIMDELLPKLQRELRPGTRLVSCDFKFSAKAPLEIIDLNRPKGKLGRFLYVYEF